MSTTYRLERIVDLLKIPVDRREACVSEILLGLSLVELADAEPYADGMVWTDDGDRSVSLIAPDGKEQLKLEVKDA